MTVYYNYCIIICINKENLSPQESPETMLASAIEQIKRVPLNLERVSDNLGDFANKIVIRGIARERRESVSKVTFELNNAEGKMQLESWNGKHASLESIMNTPKHQYAKLTTEEIAYSYITIAIDTFLEANPTFADSVSSAALLALQNSDPDSFEDIKRGFVESAKLKGTTFEQEAVKDYFNSVLLTDGTHDALKASLLEE